MSKKVNCIRCQVMMNLIGAQHEIDTKQRDSFANGPVTFKQ